MGLTEETKHEDIIPYSGNGRTFNNTEEAEDYWIEHCERFFKETGNLPASWKDLPEIIKTPRIKKFYIQLSERKKINDQSASS